MRRNPRHQLDRGVCAGLACAAVAICGLVGFAAEPDSKIDFSTQVAPILKAHCADCHGADTSESGLRLDAATFVGRGGNRGPIVVAGKPDESSLYRVLIESGDIPRMPVDSEPLTAEQIAIVRTWIEQGATLPPPDTDPTGRRTSDHWSFQPIRRNPAPSVADAEWIRTPIDAYILARLEKEGLAPSPEAARETLIRRVSLDLLGLLPSIEEVDAFVADTSPDAYEQMVDRMFASPHFGERWGRHWLDVARYADSNGFTIDGPRSIWKYRDWVIDAFNRDLPFDQFVVEQLAGDLLPDATIEQKIATGFHRNTLINQEGGTDPEQFRVESIVDRVDTTGVAFLGLTIGCAQCHEHKFDPISQREFYELFAILNNCDEPEMLVPNPVQAEKLAALRKDYRAAAKRHKDATKPAEESKSEEAAAEDETTAEQPTPVPDSNAPQPSAEVMALEAEMKAAKEQLDAFAKTVPSTMVLSKRKEPRETFIHIRGDFLRHGARVYGNIPAVLPPLPKLDGPPTRLDFARWLVDSGNPLTARVTVNRMWQALFGFGLVRTENDFGTQGEPPTHPELLDWLADEFMRQQWSMKSMLRMIVMSSTYRQSSEIRPELLETDPGNYLLARQSRLRLEAEVIRDVALSASGRFTSKMFGPGVHPPQPAGIYVLTQNVKEWPEEQGADRYRRGLYTQFWRSSPYPLMPTFDAPDANTTCTRRPRSNTPLQALTLANDTAFVELAQGLAERILLHAPSDDASRVSYGFRACLSRSPTELEQQRLLSFVESQRRGFANDPVTAQVVAKANTADAQTIERAVWTAASRVLLNLDETITRE